MPLCKVLENVRASRTRAGVTSTVPKQDPLVVVAASTVPKQDPVVVVTACFPTPPARKKRRKVTSALEPPQETAPKNKKAKKSKKSSKKQVIKKKQTHTLTAKKYVGCGCRARYSVKIMEDHSVEVTFRGYHNHDVQSEYGQLYLNPIHASRAIRELVDSKLFAGLKVQQIKKDLRKSYLQQRRGKSAFSQYRLHQMALSMDARYGHRVWSVIITS
jgi:hypothetical protein